MIEGDKVAGLLIDIAGVLYVGDEAVPGAADALRRLRELKRPLRFLTNTTRRTRAELVQRLQRLGFDIKLSEIFSAPFATRTYIELHELRPHLLVHPHLKPEFNGMKTDHPNAVVVGDAGDNFTYANMNRAFRVLMNDGVRLIAMGDNRYFRDEDGLSLDMGPFVHALSYASGIEPVIVGKPAARFFQQALREMNVPAGNALMVGDDLENDVGGAQRTGVKGVLVRTGKYQAADESQPEITPDAVFDGFPTMVKELFAD